jgi:hypothetical protein
LDQAQNISKGLSLSVHLRKVGPKWRTLDQYLILGLSPESVQDFLIKLDIKPCMLVEISIFFTKSCHAQTYQNYEQSRQKLGTTLGNKLTIFISFSGIQR